MQLSLSTIKLLISFSVLFTYNFLGGIEYAVIIPTIYNYILEYGGNAVLYGLAMSCFSIARIFFGPIFGYWYDKTHALKLILLCLNIFEIGGNVLYFMGFSKYSILAARFVCGIGASGGAIVISHLARTINKQYQTQVFTVFFACSQLGILLGPGLNFGLQFAHFWIGPFLISPSTIPGVVMGVLWTIQSVLLIFFVFNDVIHGQTDNFPRRTLISPPSDTNKLVSFQHNNYNSINNTSKESITASSRTDSMEHYIQPYFSWSKVFNFLFKPEIIALLTATFIALVNQTCIETFVVPYAEKYFYFDEGFLSLFYIICGVEGIISYVSVLIISRKISDRWLLIIGISGNIIAYCILIVAVYTIHPAHVNTHDGIINLVKLFSASTLVVLSLPYAFVGISSLYSKMIPPEIQGVSQGIRRSILCMGCIVGPIITGTCNEFPLIMAGVLEFMFIVLLILILLSWKRYKLPNKI